MFDNLFSLLRTETVRISFMRAIIVIKLPLLFLGLDEWSRRGVSNTTVSLYNEGKINDIATCLHIKYDVISSYDKFINFDIFVGIQI